MKAKFQITAKQANVITEKGVRAFVMERLLNSPFARAAVLNLDDKTVEIEIEGDRDQVRAFKEKLEKDVVERFGNPVISFSQVEEDASLEIPELMRSSQALLVGQLQKGIGVQLQILETLNNINQNLPERIAKALK